MLVFPSFRVFLSLADYDGFFGKTDGKVVDSKTTEITQNANKGQVWPEVWPEEDLSRF